MKQKTNRFSSRLARRATVAAVLVVVAAAGIITPIVRADQFDDQINAKTAENNNLQSASNDLQAQANSYQDAINKLQDQINAIQAQLAASQIQQANLQQEIIQKQADLDQQRALLGADVKSMYVDGQMSSIEMLATSKNLSDYVDKQEYRTAVQQKINDTLTKITQLQSQLKIQKGQIDQLVDNQKAQNAQLAANRQQQSDMLAYTAAQKANFDSSIVKNQADIASLKAQQRAINAQGQLGPAGAGATCGGGYPAKWCQIGQDTVLDNWGMYNRECVSYTAFRVHQDYLAGKDSHDMPYWGGYGNANQWDDNARAAGIPVDNTPTPGSIAIKNAGAYGHAMYVESVGVINGQQAVYVSQYNANLDGRYSEVWRSTDGLVFLHF